MNIFLNRSSWFGNGRNLSNALFRFLVVVPQIAWAQFLKIDDFQSYSAASAIHGQGAWQAEATTDSVAAGVAIDPQNASNRVLSIGAGGFTSGRLGHRETINTDPNLLISEGTTATLYFRLAWDVKEVDLSVGMTDVANPISDVLFNPFAQFESQLRMSFSSGSDNLDARDGSSFDDLTEQVEPLQWYDIWMVINNTTDSTEFYIQGGNFANQTLLDNQGSTSFAFRNGSANNDLITFLINTGRNTDNQPPNPVENLGPVYLDDIYLDNSGINLITPVPEPSATVASCALLMIVYAVCSRRIRRRLL